MKNLEYKIRESYNAKVMFEMTVDVDGSSFLVIYGRHINGGFCCITNWNISCEMSGTNDVFYNKGQLMRCDLNEDVAVAIASAIKDKGLCCKAE